jgi:hypothetical protein
MQDLFKAEIMALKDLSNLQEVEQADEPTEAVDDLVESEAVDDLVDVNEEYNSEEDNDSSQFSSTSSDGSLFNDVLNSSKKKYNRHHGTGTYETYDNKEGNKEDTTIQVVPEQDPSKCVYPGCTISSEHQCRDPYCSAIICSPCMAKYYNIGNIHFCPTCWAKIDTKKQDEMKCRLAL